MHAFFKRRIPSVRMSAAALAIAGLAGCAVTGGRAGPRRGAPDDRGQETAPTVGRDLPPSAAHPRCESWFEGKHFRGRGDVEYLQLLDIARRMFEPDAEFQNLSMLYTPAWNGLVEGPTWGMWWIQNSYGTAYCALPFLDEPFLTFLQNSQDLWFDQMGNGRREGAKEQPVVAPDGCLCDAARPGAIYYKQGDGRVDIHDWALEFTAAGLLMQAELLLIGRDPEAIARYLPKLERCADFLDSRRDPKTNLYLAGPAGNLLAPSYAGWRQPDGTFKPAYLAGLSITTIAALDRLIELKKMAGSQPKLQMYRYRRDQSRRGLSLLATDEGYFVKSLDPDGTRHGVYGAPRHGYFEAPPNHDAIAFRVVGDAQARRIYEKIVSIPGLRPHDLILANCPSLDDMYEKPEAWLWSFGTWVNGGHWSTCEGRMMLAYCRMGDHESCRRSMNRILGFARRFRMDNPLVKFGSEVYQPDEPINLCCDTLAPPAALVRGLFEYVYSADGVRLIPHVPPGITELHQLDPIRLGKKKLTISTFGHGPVTSVRVNGQAWGRFDAESILLKYDVTPDPAVIEIGLGGSATGTSGGEAGTRPAAFGWYCPVHPTVAVRERAPCPVCGMPPSRRRAGEKVEMPAEFAGPLKSAASLYRRLAYAGFEERYEAAHARLFMDAVRVIEERRALLASGALKPLAQARSQAAADKAYTDTALRIWEGLERALKAAQPRDAALKRAIEGGLPEPQK